MCLQLALLGVCVQIWPQGSRWDVKLSKKLEKNLNSPIINVIIRERGREFSNFCQKDEKVCANSTPFSLAVSHPSTDEARCCLTLGFFGSRSSYNFIPFFKVCLICISTTTLGIIDLIIDLFSFSSEETDLNHDGIFFTWRGLFF